MRHPTRLSLCHASELQAGQARGFDPWGEGQDSVVLLCLPQGLRAYRNLCPHEWRPLAWAKDRFLSADGAWLMCFAHGARFDPLDGRCVHGPCLGQSLHSLPLRLTDGGEVLLLGAEPAG